MYNSNPWKSLAERTSNIPPLVYLHHVPPKTIIQPKFHNIYQNTPIQSVPVKTPIQSVPVIKPVQRVPAKTPVQRVPAKTPVQRVPAKTPVQRVPAKTLVQSLPAKTHVQSIPVKTPVQYECCGKTFENSRAIKAHYAKNKKCPNYRNAKSSKIITNKKQKFECCFREFKSKKALLIHRRNNVDCVYYSQKKKDSEPIFLVPRLPKRLRSDKIECIICNNSFNKDEFEKHFFSEHF
jgi:hypothetical protein